MRLLLVEDDLKIAGFIKTGFKEAGFAVDHETNVVEARICKLRDKVDKGSDKKLIHTIRGIGYVLRESS